MSKDRPPAFAATRGPQLHLPRPPAKRRASAPEPKKM
jgi:hypothetical protein